MMATFYGQCALPYGVARPMKRMRSWRWSLSARQIRTRISRARVMR